MIADPTTMQPATLTPCVRCGEPALEGDELCALCGTTVQLNNTTAALSHQIVRTEMLEEWQRDCKILLGLLADAYRGIPIKDSGADPWPMVERMVQG